MQVESSFARNAVGGVLQVIPDPIQATPPLALNLFHLVHPDGRAFRHVRIGPVLCTMPEPQRVEFAVWGWDGFNWHLLHDHVPVWAQQVITANRADAVQLDIPGDPPAPYAGLCVLNRASVVENGAYQFFIAADDAPRWPC